MQVYFETITILQNHMVRVWLHHPYRMLVCDLNELIIRERDSRLLSEREGADTANRFTLDNVHYTEYRTLPPFQDCKMPVLIQVTPEESLPNRLINEQFILEREEFQRILTTSRSLLTLLNQ